MILRSVVCLMGILSGLVPVAAQGPVVVAFGDSITFGSGLAPEESYPAQLEGLMRQRPGLEGLVVVNAGIGGNTVVAGLARLEKDVLAHDPGAVLIGFGMNDSVMVAEGQVRVPVERFAQSLREIVRQVRAAGAVAVLATVTPVVEEYYYERHPREWYADGLPAQLERYSAAIRAVGTELGVEVLGLGDLEVTKDLRTPQTARVRDGVHPTAEGCAVIAKRYAEVLGRVLAGQ